MTEDLPKLLDDAATWIEDHAFVNTRRIEDVGTWECIGCGQGQHPLEGAVDPDARSRGAIHEATCPVANLLDRLRSTSQDLAAAREQLEKLAALSPAHARLIELGARPPGSPASVLAPPPSDGVRRRNIPFVAKAEPRALRFRLRVDVATRRMRFEPGDASAADWLLKNQDPFVRAQEMFVATLSEKFKGEITDALLAEVEQGYVSIVRALDPRAAPTIERWMPSATV